MVIVLSTEWNHRVDCKLQLWQTAYSLAEQRSLWQGWKRSQDAAAMNMHSSWRKGEVCQSSNGKRPARSKPWELFCLFIFYRPTAVKENAAAASPVLSLLWSLSYILGMLRKFSSLELLKQSWYAQSQAWQIHTWFLIPPLVPLISLPTKCLFNAYRYIYITVFDNLGTRTLLVQWGAASGADRVLRRHLLFPKQSPTNHKAVLRYHIYNYSFHSAKYHMK